MKLCRIALPLALLGVACQRKPGDTRVIVLLDPGYVQFTHAGDRLPVAAKAIDTKHAPVPEAQFSWRSADTSIATVRDGVVTALKDGITRIWAISGKDSAFAVAIVQLPRRIALNLQPALVHFDAVGDTTTLALNYSDSLVGPRPACMADDDHVAVIDTSYEVHSTGNGTTLVRCRAGDSESSMRVTVQQRIARVGIVTGVTRTLRMVLDTIHLGLAKVDKRNTPMDVGTPTWRSLDTAVIAVNAAGEAVGRAEGTGRVVAMVNGFADTTELEVIPEQPSFGAVRPALRIGAVPGQRTLRGVPGGGAAIRGIPNVSARPLSTALRARDILVSDSVFQARSMALSGGATSPFRFSVLVVQADHLLDLGAAGGQQERSGLLFGGELDASPAPKITIHLSGEYGPQLNPQGTGYAAEDIAAARGDVGLGIFPWLSLTVGGGFRTYTDAEFGTRQVWESFRGGLEANFDIGGAAHGIIGVTAMPLVSIQNPIAAGNPFGLASVAGLDYSTGKLSLGFRYELERYFFPGDRREQFGALQFRLGFNLGGQ